VSLSLYFKGDTSGPFKEIHVHPYVFAIRDVASHFKALGSSVNELLHFNFLYNSNLNDLYY